MRGTSLIFTGAIAGVGLALIATHPRLLLGGSTATAASAAYQQLNLFGDVYERVRADYVEKPDDFKLVEFRDQRHARRARSAFELHGSQ